MTDQTPERFTDVVAIKDLSGAVKLKRSKDEKTVTIVILLHVNQITKLIDRQLLATARVVLDDALREIYGVDNIEGESTGLHHECGEKNDEK